MTKEEPYIITTRVVEDIEYNPNYGDNRICQCGHTYGRHFDSYENNAPVGCKYCSCFTFVEESDDVKYHVEHVMVFNNFKTDDPLQEYMQTDCHDRGRNGFIGVDYICDHEFREILGDDIKKWINDTESVEKMVYFHVSEKNQTLPLSKIKGEKIRIKGKIYIF